ncbi:type II and III secretion system protein family protein [Ramlibacter rhizophilus]|uniref:Type II and III secretion system protein family protein n=2 Tax=Ramlibacter rhizophilus TaxID=1781167 RepID=A0A4Z0BF39_9BURK|nr:type II and III secretion system protein family protein [Ramlibacter rhizophilus]
MACTSVTAAEPITLALGKSRVIQLPSPAIRLIGGGRPSSSVASTGAPQQGGAGGQARTATAGAAGGGTDGVAETEITLLSPNELLVLGRRPGSANVIVQDREGRCVVRDIVITADPTTLQTKLRELMPRETGVRVAAAESAIVLAGDVSDTATLDQLMQVATAYGDGKKVVNLMRVSAPQQVMLEVKIAEVSKALLDRFGLDFSRSVISGGRTNFISGILGGNGLVTGHFGPNLPSAPGLLGEVATGVAAGQGAASTIWSGLPQAGNTRGATLFGLDLENRDGIVRVLAEPNIMAISGQAASFLSGGKIFIPVAQTSQLGGTTITLEEKEFGVGLKFTPTVLDGRINLKVVSEVSELSQTGTPFTTVGGVTAVLPSLSTRRVDTTVQLADGQSFAVAGLIRNNVTQALNKFPGLGEAPVIGALFRSTEFQNDLTELMFVITPRLVKPLEGRVALPTDNHVVPTRADVIMKGAGEGSMPPPAAVPEQPRAQRTAPSVRPEGAAPLTPAPAIPAPVAPPTPLTPRPSSSLQQNDTVTTAAVVGARSLHAQPLAPLGPMAFDETPHFE